MSSKRTKRAPRGYRVLDSQSRRAKDPVEKLQALCMMQMLHQNAPQRLVETDDGGWQWLRPIERRRIHKKWDLDGPPHRWWQYRRFSHPSTEQDHG